MKTEPKIKRIGKLAIGQIVVFRTLHDLFDFKEGDEEVIYLDDRFTGVLDLYQSYKREGYILFREPTILEKEFCYWFLDTFNSPVADLAILPSYIAYKNGEPLPDLKLKEQAE